MGALGRLAGGPISWGVCEVPGWGAELPRDRVLAEMSSLGLTATEAGPDGYLGSEADEVVAVLARHGLRLVGGFLPVVLHDSAEHEASLRAAHRVAALFETAGASFLVSAVVTDLDWSPRRELSQPEWQAVFTGLARLDEAAAEHGLEHVTHPHWGTLVERPEDVGHLLDGCDARFCLDTGHLALGGSDPAEMAAAAGDRVRHVHLKDIDGTLATRLRAGEIEYVPAVQQGLFRALGDGDAQVAETVRTLERAGYRGWYVLEQDCALPSADIPEGKGPIVDVHRSIEFLRELDGGNPEYAAEGR